MILKDEFKAKLDGLFDDMASRESKVREEKDREAEARENFLKAFAEVRESALAPAFEEFADYLRSKGWEATVSRTEYRPDELDHRGNRSNRGTPASIDLTVKKPSWQETYGTRLPHFSVVCDQASKKVIFHENKIAPGHGGSAGSNGGATLDQLTPDFVQGRLTDFFSELMKNVTPRR